MENHCPAERPLPLADLIGLICLIGLISLLAACQAPTLPAEPLPPPIPVDESVLPPEAEYSLFPAMPHGHAGLLNTLVYLDHTDTAARAGLPGLFSCFSPVPARPLFFTLHPSLFSSLS